MQLDLGSVLPMIKAAVPGGGGSVVQLSSAESPILRPLVGDLLVAYVMDGGDVFHFINEGSLASARITYAELHARAVENLSDLANDRVRVAPSGVVDAVLFDGNMEATLLLVPWLRDFLHEKHGAEFAVAVPARDVLAVCGAQSDAGIRGLRSVIERVFPNGDHLLSRDVFVHSADTWRVLGSTMH